MAGQSNVQVRWHYAAPGWRWWWQVDDAFITACAPDATPTPTNTPTPAPTDTPTPTPTDTPTPTPTNTPTPAPTDTPTPTPTNTPTPAPTDTPTPTPQPPNIDVNPLSMSSAQAPNTTTNQTLTVANTGGGTLNWSIVEEPASAPGRGAGERDGPTLSAVAPTTLMPGVPTTLSFTALRLAGLGIRRPLRR
ncbi:MAG: hypothetical protein HZY76_08765 [Anaerolineae bacterium]|nr:MAG: hypothetical protein HZY76_08765 [Anaerolineae bacterium]